MKDLNLVVIENGILKKHCNECVVGFIASVEYLDGMVPYEKKYFNANGEEMSTYLLHICDICGNLQYENMIYPMSMFTKRII